MNPSLDSSRFYHLVDSYHGHNVADLGSVHACLLPWASSIIFLAGDSSLDNKFWIRGDDRWKPAVGRYKDLLRPALMVADVSYHLNVLGEQHRIATINAAVEESTLRSRSGELNEHDRFVQDHLRPEDVLIVSVGGNDIALQSTMATKFNMSLLIHCNSSEDLLDRPKQCWGMKYFVKIFKDGLQDYIERLTSKTHPKV